MNVLFIKGVGKVYSIEELSGSLVINLLKIGIISTTQRFRGTLNFRSIQPNQKTKIK